MSDLNRYCPSCGSKNELGNSYCPKCGQSLKTMNSTQASQPQTRAKEQMDFVPHLVGQDDDSIKADFYDHVPRNILKLDYEILGMEQFRQKETIGDVFKQGEIMGPASVEKRDYNPALDSKTVLQEGNSLQNAGRQKGFKSTEVKE